MWSHRLALIGGVALCVTVGAATEPAPAAVAIASFVDGQVWSTPAPGGEQTPLRLFARLRPEAVVTTGAGARVVLAFTSGRRFELQAGARAVVTAEALEGAGDAVRELAAVPTSPQLLPLAFDEDVGARAGATRFRDSGGLGVHISGLAPGDGEIVLADAVALAFEPFPGVDSYRVEVEDEAGRALLQLETQASAVPVPAGVLRPGALYLWRVRTAGRLRPAAMAEVVFATLGADKAEARRALADQARGGDDADLLVLLAEVDSGLGMRLQACADLERAAELAGPNPALDEARARLGCR